MNRAQRRAERAIERRRRRALVPAHAIAHHRRGILRRFHALRRAGVSALAAFMGVLGPGMLAGLSDDDPAGIKIGRAHV